MMKTRALLASCCLASFLGLDCTPMTYSHESKVDFSVYSSVRVDVNDGNSRQTAYLIDELAAVSGFEQVIRADAGLADLFLDVELRVDSEQTTDSDGNPKTTYRGLAKYSAVDNVGRVILSDEESDKSDYSGEAGDDTLDAVAHAFLAPYRI